MTIARYRYRGQLFDMEICLAPDALERVLAQFPDRVIDWEAVQSMPHAESTPEQRAETERRLARRYAYRNLEPVAPAQRRPARPAD